MQLHFLLPRSHRTYFIFLPLKNVNLIMIVHSYDVQIGFILFTADTVVPLIQNTINYLIKIMSLKGTV